MSPRPASSKRPHTFSRTEARALLRVKQKGRCAWCYATTTALELDHIIPRSAGGSDSPANFQLLCKPCNRLKRAKIATGAQYTLFDDRKMAAAARPATATKAHATSSVAERKRQQRLRGREKGLCTVCLVAPARAGLATCEGCNERAKARVRASRARDALVAAGS